MTGAFEVLVQELKRLPGLGYRSAERLAVHLLVEKPERLPVLIQAMQEAGHRLGRCQVCGNMAEDDFCRICGDSTRQAHLLCLVEQVPDLLALEKAGVFRGFYHVLHGKLSPLHGIGPGELNLAALEKRLSKGNFEEVILALSNDIEGEATCHFLTDRLAGYGVRFTRIGFGLPSGSGIHYSDPVTLQSALASRRGLEPS